MRNIDESAQVMFGEAMAQQNSLQLAHVGPKIGGLWGLRCPVPTDQVTSVVPRNPE